MSRRSLWCRPSFARTRVGLMTSEGFAERQVDLAVNCQCRYQRILSRWKLNTHIQTTSASIRRGGGWYYHYRSSPTLLLKFAVFTLPFTKLSHLAGRYKLHRAGRRHFLASVFILYTSKPDPGGELQTCPSRDDVHYKYSVVQLEVYFVTVIRRQVSGFNVCEPTLISILLIQSHAQFRQPIYCGGCIHLHNVPSTHWLKNTLIGVVVEVRSP